MGDIKYSWVVYLLGACVALFVTAQSIAFIIKAWKEGKRIGLTTKLMRSVVVSSGVFTLVPSISILLALITLSGALGIAVPWIRLSVIGAITYELPAAEAAMQVYGGSIGGAPADNMVFSTVVWVMTIGSILPLILISLFLKKFQSGLINIKAKDSRWSDILMAAMFMGMISAFLVQGFSGGWVSILTLLSSAAIMGLCGLAVKLLKMKWLENFALPVSMIGAMCLAILYTSLLGGK